jgi:hypothetical protein
MAGVLPARINSPITTPSAGDALERIIALGNEQDDRKALCREWYGATTSAPRNPYTYWHVSSSLFEAIHVGQQEITGDDASRNPLRDP